MINERHMVKNCEMDINGKEARKGRTFLSCPHDGRICVKVAQLIYSVQFMECFMTSLAYALELQYYLHMVVVCEHVSIILMFRWVSVKD